MIQDYYLMFVYVITFVAFWDFQMRITLDKGILYL